MSDEDEDDYEYEDEPQSPSLGKKRGSYDKTKKKGAIADPISTAQALYDPSSSDTSLLYFDPDILPEPPIDKLKHKLYKLIHYDHKKYQMMIGFIATRVSIHVAAEFINVSSWSLASWIDRGNKDISEGLDTYYSRLVYDVRKAVSFARLRAEIEVTHSDPLKYLQKGSARLLGDEWVEKSAPREALAPPTSQRYRQLEDGTIVPLIESSSPEETVEEAEFTITKIPLDKLSQSLQIMKMANVQDVTVDPKPQEDSNDADSVEETAGDN